MGKGNYYCEECVEEISDEDVFWEENRPYCGRCGSELDTDEEAPDVVDHIARRKLSRPTGTDYDDGNDEEEDEEQPPKGEDLDEEGEESEVKD